MQQNQKKKEPKKLIANYNRRMQELQNNQQDNYLANHGVSNPSASFGSGFNNPLAPVESNSVQNIHLEQATLPPPPSYQELLARDQRGIF